ncbi:MAG TPA: hypothetical protein EYO59_05900 [Chromatiaceae bacterium]|nr:hypothetical protein [Chromatiaceae bacterium]
MIQKKSPPKQAQKGHKEQNHTNNASAADQRKRLLKWLRSNRLITRFEAENQLDIIALAPRVWELRHNYGLNIHTHWLTKDTPTGRPHRIASYALLLGKFRERKNQ